MPPPLRPYEQLRCPVAWLGGCPVRGLCAAYAWRDAFDYQQGRKD